MMDGMVPARGVLFIVLCMPYIPPSAAKWPHHATAHLGGGAQQQDVALAFAASRAVPLGAGGAQRRCCSARRLQLAPLSMVGNGMGPMRDANGPNHKRGKPLASETSSETMSKCTENILNVSSLVSRYSQIS
jgi:hypothetical protein